MTNPQSPDRFLVRLKAAIEADPKLTPSNLALKAGLGNSAIRLMFKNNSSPRVATMRKICAALDTTLEEFLSDAESEVEKEIVRLTIALPVELRHELLGFGHALRQRHLQDQDEPPEDKTTTQNQK